jgi:hypothetical protein
MISFIYFLACILFSFATSTFALLNNPLPQLADLKMAEDEITPPKVEDEASLSQQARRDSLNERVRRLRASSDDYVESARLLADRTDTLTQRTELLLEERTKEKEQSKGKSTTIRLRKNKPVVTKGNCNVDVCKSVCMSNCNFVCSSPVWRPLECETPQFCESTCNEGCNAATCEFAFDSENLLATVPQTVVLS